MVDLSALTILRRLGWLCENAAHLRFNSDVLRCKFGGGAGSIYSHWSEEAN
jgi:hypothetical protein